MYIYIYIYSVIMSHGPEDAVFRCLYVVDPATPKYRIVIIALLLVVVVVVVVAIVIISTLVVIVVVIVNHMLVLTLIHRNLHEEFTRLAETRLAQNTINYISIC